MKHYSLLAAIATGALILASCDGNSSMKQIEIDKSDVRPIEISCENNRMDVLQMADLFDMRHVKLETTNECLIGTIDKMRIVNDTIYVMDKYKSKLVHKFDMNGKYIGSVGKIGGGPFEYTAVSDMCVGPSGITVLTPKNNTLITYSKSGEPIAERQLPFKASALDEIADGIFAFSGASVSNLEIGGLGHSAVWTWDSHTNKVMGSAVAHEAGKYAHLFNPDCLHTFDGAHYFCDMVANDTLFQFMPDGSMKGVFAFDFGGRKDYNVMRDATDPNELAKNGKAMRLGKYVINGESLYYSVRTRPYVTHVFRNLKTGKEISGAMSSCVIQRDLACSLNDMLTSYKGEYVWSVFANEFVASRVRLNAEPELWNTVPAELAERNKAFLASMDEEDNPVLIFARPKE